MTFVEGLHTDAPVPAQKRLVDIFQDKELTSATLQQIGRGSYEDAPESARLVWQFLGEKVYPKISREFRNIVENKRLAVDGKLVKEKLKVSDEALCLQILDVKIEEFAKWVEMTEEERKDKERRKRMREENNGTTNDTGDGAARDRRKKRIKKSEVVKRDGKKSELKDRIEDYNAYYKQIEDLRAGTTAPPEGDAAPAASHSGWYEFLADKIMEQRSSESCANGAIACDPSADDTDSSSRGGGLAIAMDEEGLNRFMAV